LHQIKTHLTQVSWERQNGGAVEIVVKSRVAPPVKNWSLTTETTFRFNGESVSIRVKARTGGFLIPDTFAQFGLVTAIAGCERVKWYGRGPGESYRDKKLSQTFGNWELTVDDLFVDYEFPQDGGNRTDVRWVEFLSRSPKRNDGRPLDRPGHGRLLRARFGNLDGASFQALHYSTKDLDECTHPYELYRRKRRDTVVHLDWMHHGLGTGSCGPATLPQYELRTDQEFNVEIVLD
jgi:beta-galactosidase